jgi:hypothetical protein
VGAVNIVFAAPRLKQIQLCLAGFNHPVRQVQTKRRNNKAKQNERKVMKHQFDELAKGLAQSVTRRTALRKFGVGIGLIALAALGLANKAQAVNTSANRGGFGKPCGPGYPPCKHGWVCETRGGLTGYCTKKWWLNNNVAEQSL